MKISLKSFLVIVSFTGLICIILAIAIFEIQKNKIDEANIQKYKSMTLTMANTLIEMESFTDSLMLSALQHLQNIESTNGNFTPERLLELKKYLGISEIFIFNNTGRYIVDSKSFSKDGLPNLFSFCDSYKGLISGQINKAITPILLAFPKGNGTYKFMMMPNYNHTLILEIGIKLDFIVRTLQNVGRTYPELLSIGLYTPSGDVLGEYSVNEKNHKSEKFIINDNMENIEIHDDYLIVSRKVDAKIEDCCECQIKKLNINKLTNDNSKYFYILKAKISRKPLLAAVSEMKKTITLLCLGVLFLGLVFGRILTQWILLNLNLFVIKIEKYLKGKITASQVQLKTNDEIGFISKMFSGMLLKLEESTQMQIDNEKLRAKAELLEQKALLASQVSHDIRSPLSALNMLMGMLTDIPEQKRLLARSAIQRINDIANGLLQKGKSTNTEELNNSISTHMISTLIDSIITEKRMQYREYIDVVIEADYSDCYGIFVDIDFTEFKRVVSNLINNSVEAFENKKGNVIVHLKDLGNELLIEFRDNGKGIPKAILDKLGTLGVTHGKTGSQSGSGLGVHHAKAFIESSNGKFNIKSTLNIGTSILIHLPKAKLPTWFVPSLNLNNDTQIIILDDDQSIHNIWRDRINLNLLNLKNVELIHFTSGDLLVEWYNQQKNINIAKIFLIDYELLNQKNTGLDIIETLNISAASILVTSRYEDSVILKRCDNLNVKLIPKILAGLIPIKSNISN